MVAPGIDETGMGDDLLLAAAVRNPDERSGLDHLGHGDAEGLVAAAGDAVLVPGQELGFFRAVYFAFEMDPVPVPPAKRLDLAGVRGPLAAADDVEMNGLFLADVAQDLDDPADALFGDQPADDDEPVLALVPRDRGEVAGDGRIDDLGSDAEPLPQQVARPLRVGHRAVPLPAVAAASGEGAGEPEVERPHPGSLVKPAARRAVAPDGARGGGRRRTRNRRSSGSRRLRNP